MLMPWAQLKPQIKDAQGLLPEVSPDAAVCQTALSAGKLHKNRRIKI